MDQATHEEGMESDGAALPLPPKLLLQRLKIEAFLKRHNVWVQVNGNQLRLRWPNHVAMISVAQTVADATDVQIEAVVGKVLRDEGLAEFVRARNEQINPIQIEVAADGVVRVVWLETFPNDVDPMRVGEALLAVKNAVTSVETVLTEDFFLTNPSGSLVSQEAS